MRLLSIAILLLFIHSTINLNYQQRRIYFNESDNVCIYGRKSDMMLLTITFNDRPQIKKLIEGETGCDSTSHYYFNKLEPCDLMCLTEQSSEIHGEACFSQTLKVHRITDLILAVDQNVTVINPVSFDNIFYTCEIEGDGTVQHFGPVSWGKTEIPAPLLNIPEQSRKVNINPTTANRAFQFGSTCLESLY